MRPKSSRSIITLRTEAEERLAGRMREMVREPTGYGQLTGEPVGSRTISRILPSSLSPASVRNVMMDLEDAG